MKLHIGRVVVGFFLALSLVQLTVAQISSQTVPQPTSQTESALPRLVRFGGTAKDLNGSPLTGVVGITFALYSEQTGGAALWLETQNVTADNNGRYTVLLGSTKPDGLPAELFTSELAHWVGVQVSGQAEQPRVLLVSAPYALKAGDAETIGGLPPSAFVLAAPLSSSVATTGNSSQNATAAGVSPAAAADVTTTGGTINYLPIFSGADTIIDSAVFQTGTGATAKVGINTTTPATMLDLNGAGTVRGTLALPATAAATATTGKDSQPLSLAASAFNSTSGTALNQTFHLQAEPAANDTTAPSGTLNLLFGEGANAPAETGLKISSKGVVTFAAGQTFPGTGTITGVTAGTDLTGGGTSGKVTLNLNTTALNSSYAQLGAANTFTASQTVNGTVSATSAGNAISGKATGTSGNDIGVLGSSASPGGSGVYGENNATSGNAVGVYGTSASTAGYGVYGAGAFGGVYGSDSSATGYNDGVYGLSPNGVGVYGTSPTGTGVNGSGGEYGISGQGATGVYGSDTSAAGTGEGVYGESLSGEGVSGSSSVGIGVIGESAEGTGVYGISSAGIGVYADAGASNAVWAQNDDATGNYPTMVAENNTTATHNPVFQTSSPNTYSNTRHCTIDTSANLTCTGVVSSVVQQVDGKQTEIYAMQSAENWLEDAGSGELANGSARIELDPAFAQTVNAGVEYHVFLTPNGDSKGLYASRKTATSFEVHEQGGGASSIAFDYRIMAKRKGYENVRLEDVTERFRQRTQPAQKVQRPLPSLPPAKPKSIRVVSAPPVHPLVAPRPVPQAPKSLPVAAVRAAQAINPDINQK
jgi:hypothetical protein